MGVDHGGIGGQVPPEYGVGGAKANCPPQISSYRWPSKYAKIHFRPRPSPYSTPLGTEPPSALAIRPPEVQQDLRLWAKGPIEIKLMKLLKVTTKNVSEN